MSNEIDDLFSGGTRGPASVPLTNIGDSVQGLIYKMERLEERDDEGAVKMNEWGKPKPLFVAHVLTTLRDPNNPDDDGARRIWMKGNALWALREFLKANGLKSPKIGGMIKLELIGFKPADKPMRKPMKLHGAAYRDGTPDEEQRAYAFAAKKNDEAGQRASDDFFTGGTSTAAPQPARTTLDSMRSTFTDTPPF